MKEKMLLIDGHNLLFQMFYGMPNRILGKDGRPIHGVIGFVGAVNRLITMVEPDRVAVLFDREQPNPRSELLPQYKSNRADYSQVPEPENPFSQLPDIYRALTCMGIPHTEVEIWETDDAMAAYCIKYAGRYSLILSSYDSDLFQLIGQDVRVIRYRGRASTVWDTESVALRFGVVPEQYADFKALVGDPSDHIPGVPGVGPKTAAALLGQFGSLDALLAHPEEISRPKIRAQVAENRASLRNAYCLIKLDDRAAIPISPESMGNFARGMKTMAVMAKIGLL